MPEPAPPDQQQYWNKNLDPQNLGKAGAEWQRELAFYHTPDQEYALAALRPLAGKRVLDIGAGLGVNAAQMVGEGAVVIAMDIAHERLAAIAQQVVRNDGQERRSHWAPNILLVKAAAEALPFRNGVLDGAFSKSVLIHTRLEAVVPEIQRVLKAGGVGAFIEPLTCNPFVNAYRKTLAPKIWQTIAKYFDDSSIDLFRRQFGSVSVRHFYVFSFFAFVWQFGIRAPALFWPSLKVLHAVDSFLMRLPAVAKRAWFAVIVVRK